MANNSGWVAGRGQGISYGSAGFTAANFNSLAVGSVVVASSAITNTTAMDLYADVSFAMTNGATAFTAASYLALYVLPLNQDGTTYGDGIANGAVLPAAQYAVSSVGSPASGTQVIVGTFRGVVLPAGNFKFAVANNAAGALAAAAAATVSYRTYNEGLNL